MPESAPAPSPLRPLLGALLGSILVCLPSNADESYTGEEQFVGEIAVVERRPQADAITLFPFFVIRPSAVKGARSIADLLKWIPGVAIVETGSRAGISSVLYRGTASLHSRVFWNDIPLGLAYSGFTDLSEIPLDGVESVTVGARIGEEWLFGAPPGAVISISSRAASPPVSASAATGSFGLRKWTIAAPLANYSLRIRSESEDGNFAFINDNGTQYNPGDDFRNHRRNNHFRQWSAELDAAGDRRPVSFAFTRTREGVPGLYSLQAERPRLIRTRALLQTRFERGPWKWTPFVAYESEDFADALGEISFLPAAVTNENWRAGLSLRKRGFFTQNYADLWRSRDRIRPHSKDEAKFDGSAAWSHSRRLRWNQAWLDFSAGLQYEWRESDHPQVQPLVGARLFWGPSRCTQFFGIRRVHRFPTFLERFGNKGVVIGNPHLRPESGFNAEYGVVLVGRKSQTQLSGYASRMSHLIYYFQNSQRNFVAQNFARAIFYGFEASSQWELSDRRRVFFSATYQRAVAADAGYLSGRDLPNRPRFLYSAFVSQFIGPTEARLGVRGRVGGYYDAGNILPIDARLTAELSLFTPVSRSLRFSVTVRNIFDDQGLDFIGYPLPGRSVEFSLSTAL